MTRRPKTCSHRGKSRGKQLLALQGGQTSAIMGDAKSQWNEPQGEQTIDQSTGKRQQAFNGLQLQDKQRHGLSADERHICLEAPSGAGTKRS